MDKDDWQPDGDTQHSDANWTGDDPDYEHQEEKKEKKRDLFAEIEQSISLTEIFIQHGIKLRPSGGKQIADHCPMCDQAGKKREKGTLWVLSNDRVFKCFRCGGTGNWWSFWPKIAGVNAKYDILQRCADAAGVKIGKGKDETDHAFDTYNNLQEKARQAHLRTGACVHLHKRLLEHALAFEYQTTRKQFPVGDGKSKVGRGHKESTLAQMQVGFDDGSLVDHMKANYFGKEIHGKVIDCYDLLRTGLFKAVRPGTKKKVDWFDMELVLEYIENNELEYETDFDLGSVLENGFAYPQFSDGAIVDWTFKPLPGRTYPNHRMRATWRPPLKRESDKGWLNAEALYSITDEERKRKAVQLGEGNDVEVRPHTSVIVVEGENDLASILDISPDPSLRVIACNGQLSSGQIKDLANHAHGVNLIFCWDNDEAGDRYMRLVAKGLEGRCFHLRRYKIPTEYNDIDDYIHSDSATGAEIMNHMLFHASFVRTLRAELDVHSDDMQKFRKDFAPSQKKRLTDEISQLIIDHLRANGAHFISYWGHPCIIYEGREIGIKDGDLDNLLYEIAGYVEGLDGKNIVHVVRMKMCELAERTKKPPAVLHDQDTRRHHVWWNNRDGTLTLIEPGKASVHPNGTNIYKQFMRDRIDDSQSAEMDVKPFVFDPDVDVAAAVDLIRSRVVETMPMSAENAWFLVGWLMTSLIQCYTTDKILAKFSGEFQKGKSSAALALYTLLYGSSSWKAVSTYASFRDSSSFMPLIVCEDMDGAWKDDTWLRFLRIAANSGSWTKRKMNANTGDITGSIRSLVMITSVTDPDDEALISRFITFWCDTDKFSLHDETRAFSKTQAMEAIIEIRDTALSAFFCVMRDEVLPGIAGDGGTAYAEALALVKNFHSTFRANEHVALIYMCLKGLEEYSGTFSRGDIKGLTAARICEKTMGLHRVQQADQAREESGMARYLNGLLRRVLSEAKVDPANESDLRAICGLKSHTGDRIDTTSYRVDYKFYVPAEEEHISVGFRAHFALRMKCTSADLINLFSEMARAQGEFLDAATGIMNARSLAKRIMGEELRDHGYLIEKKGIRRGFNIWSITYYFDILKDYAWDNNPADVAKET